MADRNRPQSRRHRRPAGRGDQEGPPMASSAPTPAVSGPAEPVPVAVLARTSTLALQDPAASLRRQITSSREWLPPGFYVAGYFWDVESGGLDLDQRGHGHYEQ